MHVREKNNPGVTESRQKRILKHFFAWETPGLISVHIACMGTSEPSIQVALVFPVFLIVSTFLFKLYSLLIFVLLCVFIIHTFS